MTEAKKQIFAVVDVETTGGRPVDTKITEIGIVITDGRRILNEYSTLINPYRKIDWYVTKLTKITNEMVATAPSFEDVSDEILELLDGKTFVAHNVDFDFGLIKRELLEIGLPFENTKLCTVKSSRKVFQHLSSYSLGNIAEYMEIPLENAHRALDDARATAYLLHKILEKVDLDFLYSEIRTQNHIVELPKEWSIRDDKALKDSSGIVYFHNEESEIIYLDYSKNIQKLVYKLIDKATKEDYASKRIINHTRSLSLDYLDDSFKAELKAMNDIQMLRPRYNKPFKHQKEMYCLYLKMDDLGLYFLKVSKSSNLDIEHIDSPTVYSPSFRSASKIKDKFNHSSEIVQLILLKNQIKVDEEPMKSIHIKEYNNTILNKFFKDYCCSIKSGYYVFNISRENEVEAIRIKNYYIYSWGQGKMGKNKIEYFRDEFLFDTNQKLTRKFLNIVTKTPYKIIKDEGH